MPRSAGALKILEKILEAFESFESFEFQGISPPGAPPWLKSVASVSQLSKKTGGADRPNGAGARAADLRCGRDHRATRRPCQAGFQRPKPMAFKCFSNKLRGISISSNAAQ